MANTTYAELCSSVYAKIKDYDFIQMEESEANAILIEFIRPACLAFEDCSQDLSDRDNSTQEFNFVLDDVNFEILSGFMVIQYLDATYIRTPLMLKAHMSTTDYHKFDNKDVLGKVQSVREMYYQETKQFMINYSFKKCNHLQEVYEKYGGYTPNKIANAVGQTSSLSHGCWRPPSWWICFRRWNPPICGRGE